MSIERRVVRNARRRGVPVYYRREWGSRFILGYAKRRLSRPHKLLAYGKPADTLVQHITVTHDGGPNKWDFFTNMRTVEGIGIARFNSGVSYNAVWDMETGEIGMGQPFVSKGTHTINYARKSNFSYDQNAVALAIAALGMPGDRPTTLALERLSLFIAAMIQEGALTEDHDYKPHSWFVEYTKYAKDCPTDAVRDQMAQINARARELAKVYTVSPRKKLKKA